MIRMPSAENFSGYDGSSADPWYFPSPEEYSVHLRHARFDIPYIELIPRPTPIPDMMGWLHTFAKSFTALLPASERQAYLDCVQARLRPKLCGEGGDWTADYTRLRFRAILKP